MGKSRRKSRLRRGAIESDMKRSSDGVQVCKIEARYCNRAGLSCSGPGDGAGVGGGSTGM